jgi:tetratricopeptide (TPR) repeat protein
LANELGRTDLGLSLLRRALVLDPLDINAWAQLGALLSDAGRYRESLTAYQQFQALDANMPGLAMVMAWNYYKLGDLASAELWCHRTKDGFGKACIALLYNKRGRKAESAASLAEAQRDLGDTEPYFLADIYAELGNREASLECLEKALRSQDPSLMELQADDALVALRDEPRFKAIIKALKFPPSAP